MKKRSEVETPEEFAEGCLPATNYPTDPWIARRLAIAKKVRARDEAVRTSILGPDAREIVARALFDHFPGRYGHSTIPWEDQPKKARDSWLPGADAVLAALGGGR